MSTDAIALLRTTHDEMRRSARIAVLVPWGNKVVEAELPRFDLDRVVFHYARLVPARRYRDADQFLGEIAAAVPATLDQFARIEVDGALVACTSTGFLMSDTYASTPVVDAFESILHILSALGTGRVALATPYPTRHTAAEVAALTRRGIEVCGHASLDLGLLDDFAGVAPETIVELVHRIPTPDLSAAEAVVLSCTAWPTRDAIARLQAMLGVPVVSSNLALAYRAVGFSHRTESR